MLTKREFFPSAALAAAGLAAVKSTPLLAQTSADRPGPRAGDFRTTSTSRHILHDAGYRDEPNPDNPRKSLFDNFVGPCQNTL